MYFFTLLPLYFFTFTTYPPLGRQRMVEGNDAPSLMVHGLVPWPLSVKSVTFEDVPSEGRSIGSVCSTSVPLMPAIYHVSPLRRAKTTYSPG